MTGQGAPLNVRVRRKPRWVHRCCIGAVVLGMLASKAGDAWARASIDSSQVISLTIETRWATALGDAFIRGLRRAFQQESLLIERQVGRGNWRDVGSIPNRYRLSVETGHVQAANALGFRRVGPDPGRGVAEAPDSVVMVRPDRWSEAIVDYLQPLGTTNPPSDPDSEPSHLGVSVDIAVCAPDTLVPESEVAWTRLRVRWSERPKDQTRAQEIHGWMMGMAALQLLHRRAVWLADDVDLVFESRGRNR